MKPVDQLLLILLLLVLNTVSSEFAVRLLCHEPIYEQPIYFPQSTARSQALQILCTSQALFQKWRQYHRCES